MSCRYHLGNPLIYVFYLVLLLALHQRDWRETMFVLRCVLFSVFFLCFVMQIMKYGLGMPRPGFPWPPYPLGFINQYASFPSGHTATIITAAVPLALWFRNRPFSLFLSAVIALMGFSRVWLGQHHPIDIVGGMLLGSIAARCIASSGSRWEKEEQSLANKKYEKKRVNKITSLKDARSLALLLKQREY
ncbi:MAG: phosphatase PAP2 family protein [Bilophila wadsworthia]